MQETNSDNQDLQMDADTAPASRSAEFNQGLGEQSGVYAVKNMSPAQTSQAHDAHVESLGDDGV